MSDELNLELVPAEADPPMHDPQYQNELHRVEQSLQAQGITVYALVELRKSVGGASNYVGEFLIPLAQTIGPALGVVLVAWLRGRARRKARVKFGGVEAEAATVEEVGQLLQRVAEFQDRNREPSKDQ
jgi:hypothetical protein